VFVFNLWLKVRFVSYGKQSLVFVQCVGMKLLCALFNLACVPIEVEKLIELCYASG
jgi:hypothetical protein